MLKAKEEFNLDVAAIAETWCHSSVVRSWLLDLVADTLEHDTELETLNAFVPDSGEGRWSVLESVELGVPAPVMASALYARFASRGNADYSLKLLSMMRNAFGGHAISKK